jgi:hypothetical protein
MRARRPGQARRREFHFLAAARRAVLPSTQEKIDKLRRVRRAPFRVSRGPSVEFWKGEMSEEKPIFKVTDRRLFNPDGTPREIEREEERPAAPPSSPPDGSELPPYAGAPPVRSGEMASSGAAREREEPAPRSAAPDAGAREGKAEEGSRGRGAQERGGAEEGAAADHPAPPRAGAEPDPTAFANLVMFIASPAAAALGLSEHPEMQPGEVDLPLARHCIDLLLTLREKARGNLSAREQQIVEGILAELQMQYVSLNPPRRAAPPRGFTGGDITGGR